MRFGKLRAAAWLGLLSGCFVWLLLLLRDQPRIGPLVRPFELSQLHMAWMIPLSSLLYFVCGALVLHACGVGERRVTVAMAGLAYAVVFCVLRFHPLAAILLGLGLGTQTMRWIEPLVRRSAAVPFLILLLLMAGSAAAQLRTDHREQALLDSLPLAPAGAPNVLLITLDTVRAESLSLYGYPRPTTPFLQSYARNGVLFTQATSAAPWTLPSHVSLLTGAYQWETFIEVDPSETYPTLANALSKNGYSTAGFVANTLILARSAAASRGFRHYEDVTPSLGTLLSAPGLAQILTRHLGHALGGVPGRKSAATVNQDFLRWLGRHQNRPFFAFLNYYDAHYPYLPPTRRFGAAPQDLYDACLAYIDGQLADLIESLRQRHILDNTLVVIASDHGEHFGEHDLLYHGNSLYPQLLRVPLLMVWPRHLPVDVTVAQAVTLRDVPATVLDLVGVGHAALPGQSLSRCWTGAAATEPVLAAAATPTRYDIFSVRLGDMQYIRHADRREELYNLASDPRGLRDLMADPPAALAQLRLCMNRLIPISDRQVSESRLPTRLGNLDGRNAGPLSESVERH